MEDYSNDLKSLVRADAAPLESHLEYVTKAHPIPNTNTVMHSHFIVVDQNNHYRMLRLVEAMRARVTDYAIPRSKFRAAQLKDIESGTGFNVTSLHEEAKSLFTDLANSGEGGELLLFMIAENLLGLPQLLCKMSLKTDSRDHFKGSDGVYFKIDDQKRLLLYWGESKIYADLQSSIRACLQSLAPFLVEPDNQGSERENDILLLNNFIDLNKPELMDALKEYLGKNSPKNRKVHYCGIALCGFQHDCYQGQKRDTETMTAIIQGEVENWSQRILGRLQEEKLESYEIHFFILAMENADDFRRAVRNSIVPTSGELNE